MMIMTSNSTSNSQKFYRLRPLLLYRGQSLRKNNVILFSFKKRSNENITEHSAHGPHIHNTCLQDEKDDLFVRGRSNHGKI